MGFCYANKSVVVLVVCFTAIVAVSSVLAQDRDGSWGKGWSSELITSVPRTMSYQGILKDSGGDPVTDSIYSVIFRIFNVESGGSSLWDQTLACTTSAGYFSAIFSNVNLPFNEDYWLELEIDSEILDPRQKMNMVGYAAVSDTADYAFATATGGIGWVDDGTVIRLETSTDSVGIGITDPEAKLHVHDFNSGNKGYLASEYYGAYGRNNSTGSYGYLGGSGYGVLGSGSIAGVYGIEPVSGNFGYLGSSSYGLYARSDAGTAGYFYGNVQITDDLYTVGNVGIGQPAPDEKLHIVGNIKIEDGNQGLGKVLTSDVNGVGTWQDAAESHWHVDDSMLVTNNMWGLSRYGNVNYGDSLHTRVNLGYACTTGISGNDFGITVSGGLNHKATNECATISGGLHNRVGGNYSVIGGGRENYAYNFYTTICGGYQNFVGGNYATGSVICGGLRDTIRAQEAVIGGGSDNFIDGDGDAGAIVGGQYNIVNSRGAFIGAGHDNEIFVDADWSSIMGGTRNQAGDWYSVIGGGTYNDALGHASGAFSGISNAAGDGADDTCAFVGGGAGNSALSNYSLITGGRSNSVEGSYSCIVGGYSNNIATGADYSYLFGIDSDLTQDSTYMVDMPHIRFGDETDGYEIPSSDGLSGQILQTDGSGQVNWTDYAGSHWHVNDSVLYSNNLWGLARGNAQNRVYGDSSFSMVNWGLACTTGYSYQDDYHVTIGGGYGNSAADIFSTISGGGVNKAKAPYATIGGGEGNQAYDFHTTIGGGRKNFIGSAAASAAICGGDSNLIYNGHLAFIGGGQQNIIVSVDGSYSSIAGGDQNTIDASRSFIGGGYRNKIHKDYDESAIMGGREHDINAGHTVVGGGYGNDIYGYGSGIFSGLSNQAGDAEGDSCSFVGGGRNNTALSMYSVITGGRSNSVEGDYSCIVGGQSNTLISTADYSMAFGREVYVTPPYRAYLFNSTYDGRLALNRDSYDGGAAHPIHVGTTTSNGNGAYLTEGGTWTNGSSREFKENFRRLESDELISKISSLQVTSWNYKDSDEKHIGPVAEDFVAAFDVGAIRESDGQRDNNYLAASDVAGVALAGVKELIKIVNELKEENEELRAEIDKLKQTTR